ncbi:MAG: lysophospholipid acyltransferase family protein [Deltaproteobacteria bacterium]|nr:lysophospholipid acyltransferase family protein [Deltaproteobacteria bacterium]MBW1930877.1 lysophospholipid acyltransferase family protein [Deltaproteobacteria bacterium]MBW2027088.1 lysophospholipid acyltransferase family protein [Deltaproteobacteria bacterium]MBW2126617.1 lysophospholipid acyltransferase family protein [Deltaproteobacteria bacterium]
MEPKSQKKSVLRWYDHLLLKILPPFVAFLIRLLLVTCREIRVEGKRKAEDAISKAGGRSVFAAWHQRVAYLVRHLRGKPIVVMVSQSRDGEYGAALARLLGFRSVRGSSTRGGSEALRELTEKVIQGAWGGMVVDGPLGPPRVPKIGAMVMARNAHAPVLGVSWGADRCWILNSWDRFMIPKPFARVVVKYARPITIPTTADGDKLEEYRALLEKELNDATRWCDQFFGVERPWKKELKKLGGRS